MKSVFFFLTSPHLLDPFVQSVLKSYLVAVLAMSECGSLVLIGNSVVLEQWVMNGTCHLKVLWMIRRLEQAVNKNTVHPPSCSWTDWQVLLCDRRPVTCFHLFTCACGLIEVELSKHFQNADCHCWAAKNLLRNHWVMPSRPPCLIQHMVQNVGFNTGLIFDLLV